MITRAFERLSLHVLLGAFIALLLPAPAPAQTSDVLEEIQRFNKILMLVKHNYVDPVEAEDLIDDAIEGLLKNLDPHTNYLKPDVNERMQELNSGEYSGIGISFDIVDGVLTVISPIEGSPSWDLGIRAGDRIVEIEGESAVGITQTEVYDQLRGREGTDVRIGIERNGVDEVLPFTITRSKIAIKSVPYYFLLSEGTGYVRASRFSAHTADELEEALNGLEEQGMERLIVDLRGNSGGYLNQAISVTDKFVEGGKLVVYTKGRIRGSSEEYFSTESANHARYPLIVMIDNGSASASEIVSGAIQDWDRGLVVGTTSFGKGLVQRQFPLRGGGALLLTVAKYYTPSGRLIQRPYADRNRQQYLMEAGHPDSTVESLARAGESGEEVDRQTFMTASGRPVYGGGGIAPDVVIDPDYTPTDNQRAILTSSDRLFFNFANDYLGDHRSELTDFPRFLSSWHLDDGDFARFQSFALEHGEDLTGDAIVAEREFVDHRVRVEIAGNIWGPTQRHQVIMQNDPAIKEAVTHFDKAEMLARGDVEHYLEVMRAEQVLPPSDVVADDTTDKNATLTNH